MLGYPEAMMLGDALPASLSTSIGKEKKKRRMKAWREAHKKEVKEYNRKWRLEHLEERKLYAKQWRNENSSVVKETTKKWRDRHPDLVKKYHKKATRIYYLNHPQKVKAANDKYNSEHPERKKENARRNQIEHPEKHRDSEHRRRAIKNGVGSERINDIEIYERDKWVCQLCKKKVNKLLKYPEPLSPSLDHIIPLSKEGSHIRANVQLAHLKCNIKTGVGGVKQQRLF